jgi:hypothetical protein
MKRNPKIRILALTLLLATACTMPFAVTADPSLQLAVVSENYVTVTVSVALDSEGQAWLSAAFVPSEPQIHLYGKDLPREGVDGLGRPTLLELVPGSCLRPMGSLRESITAEQGEGPDGLLVYPPGPVTLRMPVGLPEGEGWTDDQVSVTYVACSGGICKLPVVGKLIAIRVPGITTLKRDG